MVFFGDFSGFALDVFLIWFLFFDFLVVWCFSGVWFFWFFDVFWWFFGFLYDFFLLGLNYYHSPKWVQSFKILLKFFFFHIYYSPEWCGHYCMVTGWEYSSRLWYLTGYALAYIHTPESIKKYKRWRFDFSRRQRLQVAWYFLEFYLLNLTE